MNSNETVIAQTIRAVLGQEYKGGMSVQSQVSRMTANITLDFAELLMKKVEEEAKRMGMKVVTAVADAHGNPVAVRCMDDAFIGSYDVALNKTYTSIAFKMSTEELGKLSQSGKDCDLRRRRTVKDRREHHRSLRGQRRKCRTGYLPGAFCDRYIPADDRTKIGVYKHERANGE